MKYNFKQIAAVAMAGLATVGLTGAGAAANYPAPFVEDGQADFAVVHGSGADSLDEAGATQIANDLLALATTTVTGIGDESVNIGEEAASELHLNSGLSILTDVTDLELPTLLADRTIRTDDDGDIDYFSLVTLGGHTVDFGNLGDEENYVVNTNLADDLRPVLHVDQGSGEAWSLEIEFDESFNATDLRSGETLNILGTEWSFDPSMSSSDQTLVLFGAAQSEVVGLQETATFSVEGETYDVTITSGAEDPDRVHVSVDGTAYRNLEEGDDFTHDDQKFIINEVTVSSIGVEVDSISAEIFAGADELEISGTSLQEVDVNDEVVRGLEANFTNAAGAATEVEDIHFLNFVFTPSEMESDRDENDYLEIGETVVDPVFGTLALTFDSASQDFEDGEYFEIDAGRDDDVRVTLSNDAAQEYNFKAYEDDEGTLVDNVLLPDSDVLEHDDSESKHDGKLLNLNRSHEDMNLILTERDTSKVLGIDRVNTDRGEDSSVRFRDQATGESFTVEHGDTFLRREYRVVFYDDEVEYTDDSWEGYNVVESDATSGGDWFAIFAEDADWETSGTGEGVGSNAGDAGNAWTANNTFLADNDVEVTFGAVVAGTPDTATITIDEQNMDVDVASGDLEALEFTIENDGGSDTDETKVTHTSGTVSGSSDDENEFGYYLTQHGSYIETEEDDDTWARVWVPEESTEYNVHIGGVGEAEDEIELGDVLVTDNEVDAVQNRNLIVVGGSCINSVAASLVGGSFCGSDWSDATGVGSGQYLIQSFENSDNTDKIALLVAGYERDDTSNAVSYLRNQGTGEDISVGSKYTGSTATEVTSVTTSE